MKKLICSTFIVGVQFWSGAWADGLIHNGHVSAAHTTFQLTQEQIRTLQSSNKLMINSQQKKKMLQETGVSNVQQLQVYPATTTTCTCELANIAVRVGNTVEVPNFLYGRNQKKHDVFKWTKRRDEEVAFVNKFEKLKDAPKPVKLFLQAQRLSEPKKAIPLLQEAIKLDPNLKWARRELAEILVRQANDAKLSDKLALYQKASSVIDREDTLMIEDIQEDLARTKARLAANE